jgi:hypothetical protein
MKMKRKLYFTDAPPDVGLNPEEHNYIKLMEKYASDILETPGIHDAHVEHDNNCAIYKMGNCNCKPNITIKNYYGDTEFILRWKS